MADIGYERISQMATPEVQAELEQVVAANNAQADLVRKMKADKASKTEASCGKCYIQILLGGFLYVLMLSRSVEIHCGVRGADRQGCQGAEAAEDRGAASLSAGQRTGR